jgi:lysophospholipase L1-like esterase
MKILGILVLAGLGFLLAFPPGPLPATDVPLARPFAHHRGFAYLAPMVENRGNGSELRLIEDGRELGPAGSIPDNVANQGGGSFLEWKGMICFSASDSSDPNENGRVYAIRVPGMRFPVALYLGVILFTYLGASFLLHGGVARLRRGSERAGVWWGAGTAVGDVILAVLFMHLIFGVVICRRLLKEGPQIERWYSYAFEGGDPGFQPGKSLYFVEHHYLDYALNPDIPYGGTKQFDRSFRIRRSETIRPRDQVKWRLLVLGGSTTFGEGMRREEDTWVYRLEELVRKRYGSDYDVINGGVLGYTIAENFIHYVTLLTNLEPDVVLLYTGINDVHPRLFGRIAYDYSNYRLAWRSGDFVLPPANPALAWFNPYRYYFLMTKILRLNVTGIGGLVSGTYPPPNKWETELATNGPEVYRTYLKNLVRLIRAQNRAAGIIPQYFRATEANDILFVKGVEQHNVVNREVASELHIPFAGAVIDGKTFGPADTYDSCHFNEAGGRVMARVVFEFLQGAGLVPPNGFSN